MIYAERFVSMHSYLKALYKYHLLFLFPFLYYRYTAQSDNERILTKTSNMPSGAAVLQTMFCHSVNITRLKFHYSI